MTPSTRHYESIVSVVSAAGIGLILSSLVGWSCTTPCTFEARCVGDVMETCSISSDQIFGDGVSRTSCQGANPRCVEPGENQARCVADPVQTCTSTLQDACRGNVLLACVDGYVNGTDCGVEGPSCVELPGGGAPGEGARCAISPLRPCDESTFDGTCEGSLATRCTDGYVVGSPCEMFHLACSDLGSYGGCVR